MSKSALLGTFAVLLAGCGGAPTQSLASPLATLMPSASPIHTAEQSHVGGPQTPPTTSPQQEIGVTGKRDVAFTELVDCGGSSQCSLKLDIYEPQLDGTLPVAVLIPGSPGGPGHRRGLDPFAKKLAGTGVLVFNADYRSGDNAGPFPIPVDDAACAVRFARAHAAEFGGDPAKVILLGHSLGGWVALLEGLGAAARAGDCLATGDASVSAVVALEPPFRPFANDDFWTNVMGGTIAELPDEYAAADTSAYVGVDPSVAVRVLWGDEVWSEVLGSEPDLRLVRQLEEAGYDASTEELFGADHFGGIDVAQAADQTIAMIHELPGFDR